MAFMRNRRPMRLKRFAAAHNALLFSLSLYMSVECIRQASAMAQVLFRAIIYAAVAAYEVWQCSAFMHSSDLQSYRTFRWDQKFQLWCNANDSRIGGGFTPDGYRLARVLWIHYLSKVRNLFTGINETSTIVELCIHQW